MNKKIVSIVALVTAALLLVSSCNKPVSPISSGENEVSPEPQATDNAPSEQPSPLENIQSTLQPTNAVASIASLEAAYTADANALRAYPNAHGEQTAFLYKWFVPSDHPDADYGIGRDLAYEMVIGDVKVNYFAESENLMWLSDDEILCGGVMVYNIKSNEMKYIIHKDPNGEDFWLANFRGYTYADGSIYYLLVREQKLYLACYSLEDKELVVLTEINHPETADGGFLRSVGRLLYFSFLTANDRYAIAEYDLQNSSLSELDFGDVLLGKDKDSEHFIVITSTEGGEVRYDVRTSSQKYVFSFDLSAIWYYSGSSPNTWHTYIRNESDLVAASIEYDGFYAIEFDEQTTRHKLFLYTWDGSRELILESANALAIYPCSNKIILQEWNPLDGVNNFYVLEDAVS